MSCQLAGPNLSFVNKFEEWGDWMRGPQKLPLSTSFLIPRFYAGCDGECHEELRWNQGKDLNPLCQNVQTNKWWHSVCIACSKCLIATKWLNWLSTRCEVLQIECCHLDATGAADSHSSPNSRGVSSAKSGLDIGCQVCVLWHLGVRDLVGALYVRWDQTVTCGRYFC